MKHSCRARLVTSSVIVVLGGFLAGCSTSLDSGATMLDGTTGHARDHVGTAEGDMVGVGSLDQDVGSLDQQVTVRATFPKVVAMSDAVVLGTVVDVERGPNEGPLEFPEGQLATGRVTVDVSHVLSGDPTLTDDGTLFVTFGTGPPIGSDEVLSDIRSTMPTTEMLWVLTSVERAYPGQSLFVLSNLATLVEDVDGGARSVFFRATAAEASRGSLSAEKAQSVLGPLVSEIARMDFDSAVDVASNAPAREP